MVPISSSSQPNNDPRKQFRRTLQSSSPSRLSHEQVSDRLHRVLVSINRSLLQYASQCAPWTPVGEAGRLALIRSLAATQQESIQQLCDLLIERRDTIDWGAFPVEYTSYNFVSLDFLWPKIISDQTPLERLIEAVRDELRHETQVTPVLDDVVERERGVLAELTTNHPVETSLVSFAHRSSDRDFTPLRQAIGEHLSAV
ncbi:MAG: hypothetical protein R3C59_21615 [Planctomycetaceae bacterium]